MYCINAKDSQGLLDLYDESAILIPTFSNKVLDTQEKIHQYFEMLAQREGLSISLHEKTFHIQKISDVVFTLSGIYLWKFVIDEELLNFEARFSYVVDVEREHPILHHHSSQIPRMI
jgi:hypothetical protein